MFQECFKEVLGNFKGTTWAFQGCFKCVSSVFELCLRMYLGLSWMFQGCFNEFVRVFQECFSKAVKRKFQKCFIQRGRFFQGSFKDLSRVFLRFSKEGLRMAQENFVKKGSFCMAIQIT